MSRLPDDDPSGTAPARRAAHAGHLPHTALTIVTGKGGVGRSTVAAAMADGLAERGGRVALVHPADAPPARTAASRGRAGRGGPDVVGLDRDDALASYVGAQLPGPLAAALRASRAFRLVTAATPGLAELLAIGELRRLATEYDHLVFDAPATGHLLAMFDAPGRFERAAVAGPVARRARDLGAWIGDPAHTSIVLVTTGDGLAVSEMIELGDALRDRTGHVAALVVANRLAPVAPTGAELATVRDAHPGRADRPRVAAVDHVAHRGRSERSHLGRITRQLGITPIRAYEQPGRAIAAVCDALGAHAASARVDA